MCSEILLSGVVGTGQIGDIITVEKAWPVATRDLEELVNGRDQRASRLAMAGHGAAQAAQPALDSAGLVLVWVGEERGDSMPPAKGPGHVGPQRGGVASSPEQERFAGAQWRG